MAEILEGKELEGNIGAVGSYEIDAKADGTFLAKVGVGKFGMKASVLLEGDVIELLREIAKKSENSLDDAAVDALAKLLGRA